MRARSVSWGRRDFLRRAGAVPSTLLLVALGNADEGWADAVSPTPACDEGHGPTPRADGRPIFPAALTATHIAARNGDQWTEDRPDRAGAVDTMQGGFRGFARFLAR